MNIRTLHDRPVVRGSDSVRDAGTRVPLGVRPGDLILFGTYASQEITVDGDQLLIMRESEVLAVVQDASTAKEST